MVKPLDPTEEMEAFTLKQVSKTKKILTKTKNYKIILNTVEIFYREYFKELLAFRKAPKMLSFY